MKKQKIFIYINTQTLKQEHILASSLKEAKQQLIIAGMMPYKLKPHISFFTHSQKKNDLLLITRQIAIMLQAGLPLLSCLQLFASEYPNLRWRYIIADLQKMILSGLSFSQSLEKYPQIFPHIYREMVATAELTGRLDECCFQLTYQLEKAFILRKKIINALRYPLFVLAISLVVVLLMLILVLPKFSQLYADFDSDLPTLTQGLISLSQGIKNHFILFFCLLCIVTAGYYKKLHPRLYWQKKEQQILLNCPVIGQLLHLEQLYRFFQSLSMTQHAGILLLEGLISAKKSLTFECYKIAVSQVYHQIEQGSTLSQSLKQQTLFPALAIQLLRVGEESGAMDIMLEKVTTLYQQQLEELADNLSQKIEPVIMVVLGVIIGSFVIAMYLPILQLGNIL